MQEPSGHIPVLLEEVLSGLQVGPGKRMIDATVGACGHAVAILHRLEPDGHLLGIDADPEAVSLARKRLSPFGKRATLATANFRDLGEVATRLGFRSVDGILLDLGISSRQLDSASRGFSFSHDGPLDMRLGADQSRTAADLVNTLPEEDIAEILWRFGEERQSRRIARAIVRARPLSTTGQLAKVVARTAGRRKRIHPATRTFQALRIAVNDELESLIRVLPQARDLLKPGGRLAVIAFHSLEDRIVKRFFRQETRDCTCPPEIPICICEHTATLRAITRKAVQPSEREIAHNPRSRSARLRIVERIEN